jgi:hypothetical protein
MDFSTAALVEQVIWDMRVADVPRGDNRAQIDRLFDGFPPWTMQEAENARINTNVNFLDGPKLAADARRSYYNAFLKPKTFFTLTLDAGPARSRPSWSAIVTKEINRTLKNSLPYFEVLRSQIAATVLHGIGPVTWSDDMSWLPTAVDLPNLLIPSRTLLSLKNLCHFAIYREYTAPELSDMIERKDVDPGWNLPLARKAVAWCLKQGSGEEGWGMSMSQEKIVEQVKEDGVFYASDSAPTVNCWDFYYLASEGKQTGWRRRIILDTPANTEIKGEPPGTSLIGEKSGQWLYNGGDRVFASDVREILHFQFGDLSAKSPFRYHSVRSLGWLIYAVCNLQNRLRCKVNDATFESLLNYFRVNNKEDADRLTKIDLHNYGVVPEGVEFVKQQDRWQVNQPLVAGTMTDNRTQMNEAAAQFREGRENQSSKEKTATEIMAEVNSANALVGTMLLLGYTYQKPQYAEITRRFFMPNSTDIEVLECRKRILKQGVPAELLKMCYWDVTPEQVLGSGNKTLQIAMADKLMQVRPLLDPDAQRDALRIYIEANSDDAGLGSRWIPDKPIMVTESMHDAQLMIGSIMAGVQVAPRAGQDFAQMTTALLKGMAEIVKRISTTTQLPTQAELAGLSNLATTVEFYVEQLAQDEGLQELYKQSQADLTELAQIIKQWATELEKNSQQAGAGAGAEAAGEQATTQAKLQAIQLTAQTKAQIAAISAKAKLGQKQEQFAQKQQQTEEKHTADLRKKLKETEVGVAIADATAAQQIKAAREMTKAKFKETEKDKE